MAYALVIICFLLVVGTLFYKSSTGGVEAALPAFAFFTILLPTNCAIPIPGVFGLTVQRLAVITLLLCFLLFRPKLEASGNRDSTPLIFLMLLQFAWALVSTAHSIVPVMSLKKLIGVVLEYYAVYYVFYRSIKSTEIIQRIVTGIVAAMALTTIPGAVEAYTGWEVTSWFPVAEARFGGFGIDEARGVRTASTFPHAILYGSALAMAIPLTLYVIANAKSTFKKALLWLGLLLMFLCLYKTGSRGPWLASIMGFLLVMPLTTPRVRKYMIVVVGLCATVMVVRPGVYDTVRNYYYESVDPDNPMSSSYEYRYALKDVAVMALSRSTGRELWGYGMESFYFLHLTGPFLGKEEHKFESCDSAWTETMVETGYVGLAIFAALLFGAAFRILKAAKAARGASGYLCWIFFVSVLQYFFLMVSVAIYAWGQNGYMLWIVIAMGLAYGKLEAQTVEEDRETLAPTRAQAVSRAFPKWDQSLHHNRG